MMYYYLYPNMINGFTIEFRKQVGTDSIKPLSERLALLKPKVVIIVIKVLENEVNKLTELSRITSVKYSKVIPFSAHSKTSVDKCVN